MGSGARPRQVETVVVGAGQAGLVMSSFLSDAGREHVLLERRDTLGGGWQDRWDAFRLVSPNWVTSLPGFPYEDPDPDAFMPRDSVVARVRRYAEVISAPVELATGVSRLSAREGSSGGLRVETSREPFDAHNVVVATGGFPSPRIPAVAADLPARIVKVHSHEYRNEAALPPGAVLVVGTGQSGVQLAEELHGAGRRVILSVGHCGRIPRRYRGRDIFAWMVELVKHGKLPSVDKLPDPRLRFAVQPPSLRTRWRPRHESEAVRRRRNSARGSSRRRRWRASPICARSLGQPALRRYVLRRADSTGGRRGHRGGGHRLPRRTTGSHSTSSRRRSRSSTSRPRAFRRFSLRAGTGSISAGSTCRSSTSKARHVTSAALPRCLGSRSSACRGS